MAAKNENVTVTTAWGAVSDTISASSTLSITNLGKAYVILMATTGSAPSSSSRDGIILEAGSIIVSSSLGALFPGVSSATTLYARTINAPDTEVFISHEA